MEVDKKNNERYFIKICIDKKYVLEKLVDSENYSDMAFDMDNIKLDSEGNLDISIELFK